MENVRWPANMYHTEATQLNVFSLSKPYMLTFHASWLSFFCVFISTFAPAALLPVIRNVLDLSSAEVWSSHVAAFAAPVLSRVLLGVVCDIWGPRYGHAGLILCCCPAVFCMAIVDNGTSFIMARFFSSFALGVYVSAVWWAVTFFSPFQRGKTTSVTAGWGNLGGGVGHLVLPHVYYGLRGVLGANTAWRLTLLLTGTLMLLSGVGVLAYTQDFPCGRYWEDGWEVLQVAPPQGNRDAARKSGVLLRLASRNYRTWVLMLLYATCFGVEITMFTVLPTYFAGEFGMSLATADVLTSVFGIAALFARPMGGVSSDWCGRQFGMRGRFWLIFLFVLVQGISCIVLGLLNGGLAVSVIACATFSIMVQAAEGAVCAVVNFVSFRAQGTVQGMVGAAGTFGAVIYLITFFNISVLSMSAGFIYMGVWTCVVSMSTLALRFPMWGSMLKRGSIQSVEEDYFGQEWTTDELLSSEGVAAMLFATQTISERGRLDLIKLMQVSAVDPTLHGLRADNSMGNHAAARHLLSLDSQNTRDVDRSRTFQTAAAGASQAPTFADVQDATAFPEKMQARLAMLDRAPIAKAEGWDDFMKKHAPLHSELH